MSFLIVAIIFGVLVLVALSRITPTPTRKSLNHKYFERRWLELLARVKTPEGMVLAVIDADKLLDEALKKRHYKGKTMGVRLVHAQRSLKNNDSVWYAHKLRNRLVHEPGMKLKESEAKRALSGFRDGLKDLGAL